MKPSYRMMTLITLITFVLSDLTTVSPAQDMPKAGAYLSPASTNSTMFGRRHSETGRIRLLLQAGLKEIFTASGKSEGFTIEDLRNGAAEKVFRNESLLGGSADIHFFFSETSEVRDGLLVKCRIRRDGGVEDYFAVFSLVQDAEGGFPVSGIFTKEECDAGRIAPVDRGAARDERGRYAEEPGKSPDDALRVIALSGLLEKESFTLKDYFCAYVKVSARHPEFGFKAPSYWWQSTFRRDLYAGADSLEAKGLLAYKNNGGRYEFTLTDAGRSQAGAIAAPYKSTIALEPNTGSQARVLTPTSNSPKYFQALTEIARSRAWARLQGIGSFLPSFWKVRGENAEGINVRANHVLRGLDAAAKFAEISGVKLDTHRLSATAFAYELGRLPLSHFSEKRPDRLFSGNGRVIAELSILGKTARRYDQALAQELIYKRDKIALPDEVVEDVKLYILKDPASMVSPEARMLFYADELEGLAEDLVLAYKLQINGKNLISDVEGIEGIYEYIFGRDYKANLDNLKIEEFSDFLIGATILLMRRVIDPDAVTIRESEMGKLRQCRQELERTIFPAADRLVDVDGKIVPALDRVRKALVERIPTSVADERKDMIVLKALLEMDETRFLELAGVKAEDMTALLEWRTREVNDRGKADTAGERGKYFIGMSMGGTKLYVALYEKTDDAKPSPVDSRTVEWMNAFRLDRKEDVADPEKLTPDAIVAKIAASVLDLMQKNGVTPDDISKIGCTSPGPVSSERGIIGLNSKTFNLPFHDYPFVDKLAETLKVDPAKVMVEHDARSGLDGEMALGLLRGIDNGYYVIQGTGLGGSLASHGKYMTSFPELTEPGHHLVGEPNTNNLFEFSYRLISRRGKKHPREVVSEPDPKKEYQITSWDADALIAEGREKRENFIWHVSGERDIEDVVSGKAVEAMVKDKHRLWAQFGGEKTDYDRFNEPRDISMLAFTGTDREKKIAREIMKYIAQELGKALATLVSISKGKSWEIERIVVGSTLGERMGIGPGGDVLLADTGEDYYFYHIRRSARDELVTRYGFDPDEAGRISAQILRTNITQEVRETAGFGFAPELEDDVSAEVSLVDGAREMLIDLMGTSGDFEVKAVIAAILLEMGHEAESQLHFLSEIRSDVSGMIRRLEDDFRDTSRAARVVEMIDGVLERYRGHDDSSIVFSEETLIELLNSLLSRKELDYEAAAVARLTLFSLGERPDEQREGLLALRRSAEANLRGNPSEKNRDANKARQVVKIHELSREIERRGTGYFRNVKDRRTQAAAGTADALGDVSRAEIDKAVSLAREAGIQLVPPVRTYTLFVSADMYCDREFETDKVAYSSRFRLERVRTDRAEAYVNNVLSAISREGLVAENVVVQLPAELTLPENRPQINRLLTAAPGIRFMVIDLRGLKEERERSSYRNNVYAMMLLARNIDKDTPEDSNVYRLLWFMMKSMLADRSPEDIALYISALARGDIETLVGTVLSYKPLEKYDLPGYYTISAALMSA